MAITGVTEQEYLDFLSNGGNLIFEIDANDIDASGSFDKSPFMAPYLRTGFEVKPSPIIDDPAVGEQALIHGDPWTRIVTFTYRRDGTIVYKKLPSGRYEARVSAP